MSTTIQTETIRLVDEAVALIEQTLDMPSITREMLHLVLGKLADVIVLNGGRNQ